MNHGEKTRIGIEKARASGVTWGAGGQIQGQRNSEKAAAFAELMKPIIFNTMLKLKWPKPNNIATELNKQGIPTAKGGEWHNFTVKRLLDRYGPTFRQEVADAKDKKHPPPQW